MNDSLWFGQALLQDCNLISWIWVQEETIGGWIGKWALQFGTRFRWCIDRWANDIGAQPPQRWINGSIWRCSTRIFKMPPDISLPNAIPEPEEDVRRTSRMWTLVVGMSYAMPYSSQPLLRAIASYPMLMLQFSLQICLEESEILHQPLTQLLNVINKKGSGYQRTCNYSASIWRVRWRIYSYVWTRKWLHQRNRTEKTDLE